MSKVVFKYYLHILIALFSINSLATSIITAMLNNEWSQLSPTTKFCVIWLIIQNWTGTMLAFVNKAFARSSDRGVIDVSGTVSKGT